MRKTHLAIVGLALVVAGVVSLTRPSAPLEGAPVPHDIPADAIVRMFVKPEGDRLRLLVRVPLNTMQDIVDSPQLNARAFFAGVDDPALGRLMVPGAPLKMSATPWRTRPAPMPGQHSLEVLEDRTPAQPIGD